MVYVDENRLASAENAAISGVTVARVDYVDAGVAAQEVESVDENAAAERPVNGANAYEARPEMAVTDVGLSVAAEIADVASTATLAETYAPHAVNDCGCSDSDCTEKIHVRFLNCFRLQYTSSCSQCDANDLDPFPLPQVVFCPNTRCWSPVLSS